MIKSVVLVSTLLLSLNAFSASILELNATLIKVNSKKTPSSEKIIYTGKDIIRPTIANANKLGLEGTQTEIG
ncbi:MAG: hypothetical protein K0S27_316 [Gammaproteobacteria bacterium]|nr:hypothetical protein [Gammaproteobacteria bacterium]